MRLMFLLKTSCNRVTNSLSLKCTESKQLYFQAMLRSLSKTRKHSSTNYGLLTISTAWAFFSSASQSQHFFLKQTNHADLQASKRRKHVPSLAWIEAPSDGEKNVKCLIIWSQGIKMVFLEGSVLMGAGKKIVTQNCWFWEIRGQKPYRSLLYLPFFGGGGEVLWCQCSNSWANIQKQCI